jgi:hypothetical protein
MGAFLKSLGAGCAMALLAASAATPAGATKLFRIEGSGVWGANAPTTPYSIAGESFSFSFVAPKTYSFIDYGVVKAIPPTQITDFSYSLGGQAMPTAVAASAPPACSGPSGVLCSVEVVAASAGGGFNLDFTDYSVDLYGLNNADIGSQGTLVMGKYGFIPNINGYPSAVNGAINEGVAVGAVVPEPSTWLITLLGFAGLGATLRGSRRRRARI